MYLNFSVPSLCKLSKDEIAKVADVLEVVSVGGSNTKLSQPSQAVIFEPDEN